MKKIFLSTVLSLSLISASFCPQISTGTNKNATAGDYETTTTTVGTSDVMFQTTTTAGTYTSTPFISSGTLHDFIENSTSATTRGTLYDVITTSTTVETEKQPLTIGRPDEDGYYHIEAGYGIGFSVSGYYNDPNSDYYDGRKLCFTVEVDDPSIASVNYRLSGECNIWIDALSPGETTVTMTAPDGRSVSANIMVEEETLKIGSYGGYRYGEDFCEISFENSKLFCLWVTGCENPDPEEYCNGKTWFTFEIADPSVAKINSIETDSIYHGNDFTVDALSVGETVLTVYAPDGRSASFRLIVVDPQQTTGTTIIDPTITTTTTEITTETGTSGTTILTYFNEHGVLVDEFGNAFINNGTSVVGTFNTTTTTVGTFNITTTSDDNTTTTTTETTSSNPDDELPQTGNSNIFYKVVVGVASAMTITGTAMVAYSKKKDEE